MNDKAILMLGTVACNRTNLVTFRDRASRDVRACEIPNHCVSADNRRFA